MPTQNRTFTKNNPPKQTALYQKEVKKRRTIEESIKREAFEFRKQFAKKTLNLITSGFGIVAALAWNEVIKESVNIYIKPFFGESSGVISLLIYAIVITVLVIFVTYNLSKFEPEEKD